MPREARDQFTRDQFNGSVSRTHRFGLILAGGDGKRLLPLTRKVPGAIEMRNAPVKAVRPDGEDIEILEIYRAPVSSR
jgi:hypothetical protein